MPDGEPKSLSALGFLTVVEHPRHGLFGGYLVLGPLGRPLEFHCTAPVKPNRAQEILYGPTLRPFLYGEQIGLALAGKSKTRPPLILTDEPAVMALAEFCETPVALVMADAANEAGGGTGGEVEIECGGRRLALAASCTAKRDEIIALLEPIAARIDLTEPFGRIRDAIDEAQRAA